MIARTKAPPWLPIAAAAIPALLLFVQILQSWINIPFWDEWELIARLRLAPVAGTLRPLDLFAQHNDSRFALPQLLLLPLARLTHWDLRAEMLMTFGTVCVIAVLLWSLFGAIKDLPRWARVASLLVCNCLLFSPVQYETWLWGMNFSLVLPPLLLLLTIRINVSARSLSTKVGWNILLCVASTFSNSNGMGNWLLAFPGFTQNSGPARKRLQWYAIYVAAAIATIVLFFLHYQRHVGIGPVFESPLLLLNYYFCWLGAPLALSWGRNAWIIGLSVSLVFVLLAGMAFLGAESDRHRSMAYAFTALGCYAAMAGMAASLGRVGMEFDWALSSRYTTFSIYLPIAVVGLAALHFSHAESADRPIWKRPGCVVPTLIVVCILGLSVST